MFTGTTLSFSPAVTFTAESLNAAPATLMLGYSFIADDLHLSYFWVNIGAVYGTDANRKITFELQADDGTGIPSGTALASFEQTGGWTAETQKKIQPSWSATTLTLGARYWIVCKNTAAAPTTDYVQLYRGQVKPLVALETYNAVSAPFIRRQFNGTNWTAVVLQHQTTLTLKYTSGLLSGIAQRKNISYDSAYVVSSTRSVGAQITVPLNSPVLNIKGVGLYFLNTSTSKIRAYINRAFVAESSYANPGLSVIYSNLPISFSIGPGDTLALMSETGTWNSLQPGGSLITDDTDFRSMQLWSGCHCKIESGVWYTNSLYVPSLTLYLDKDQPFSPAPINRRQFNNQR